jgi:hypothetical protein
MDCPPWPIYENPPTFFKGNCRYCGRHSRRLRREGTTGEMFCRMKCEINWLWEQYTRKEKKHG